MFLYLFVSGWTLSYTSVRFNLYVNEHVSTILSCVYRESCAHPLCTTSCTDLYLNVSKRHQREIVEISFFFFLYYINIFFIELLQKCSDNSASTVPTFARTEPPDTQVTKSVIALLLHYEWNKFTIIAESAWSTVARSLEDEAVKHNLTVNHHRTVEDRHTCCVERLPCCQVGIWFQLIQETKNMTRS